MYEGNDIISGSAPPARITALDPICLSVEILHKDISSSLLCLLVGV